MLYISRFLGRDKYAVVDTDDGKEEVVYITGIREAIRAGVEIKGVEVSYVNGHPYIDRIGVYQLPNNVTGKQAKMLAMAGVSIKTNGDVITSISWDDNIVKDGLRIRLSDFGRKCGDDMLKEARDICHKIVIFVLDDKITVRAHTFISICRTGAKLDLTAVTKPQQAKLAYWECMESTDLHNPLDSFVIDRRDRFLKCAAFVELTRGVGIGEEFPPDTTAWLEDLRFEAFKELADCQFKFVGDFKSKARAKEYISGLKQFESVWRSQPKDFDKVFLYDKCTVFPALDRATTCNPKTLKEFSNMISRFIVSQRMKDLYVKLTVRANNWFLDLYKAMNWRVSADNKK